MRSDFSRMMAITLAVLWLMAMVLIPAAVPVQAAGYNSQPCPPGNDVITLQDEAPWHELPSLYTVIHRFLDFAIWFWVRTPGIHTLAIWEELGEPYRIVQPFLSGSLADLTSQMIAEPPLASDGDF